MKVLVVDDSATMRRIITRVLGEIQFKDCVEADNGESALRVLNQGGIELILTDWNMPVMNGLEFVNQLRVKFPDLPVLMVTTNASPEDVVQALQAGVNSYVVKPFTPDTLKRKLMDIVGEQV